MRSATPVVVVSGFLGSGKTTLLSHLLAEARHSGTRFAVISNEFGALGIDSLLLDAGHEAFVELEGGCVCCKLSDELGQTLQLLHERVDPDAILIETSGVALPNEVQLNLWREPVCTWVSDDLAVVVVNAEQVQQGRDLDLTFEVQVSSADLLVLNQVDRVAREQLGRIEQRLREIEPEAPIIQTRFGQLDPLVLFPPDPAAGPVPRRSRETRPGAHPHEQFHAEQMTVEQGLDPAVLIQRLERLGAVRIKGFVRTAAGLRLVQGVGPRIDLQETHATPSADQLDRLVWIHR